MFIFPPPSVWPHLFRGAGHEKRREEQLKWSLAFRLYSESFPCAQLPGPVHTTRLGRVCFCIFSLGLCFVCSFVLFDLFVCPHACSFMFPWAVESSPSILGRCKQKQRGLRGLLCRWPSVTEWEVHITAQGPPSPKWPVLCRVGR